MNIPPQLKGWHVALHHSKNREHGIHVETIEQWMDRNIDAIQRRVHSEWFVVGFAPTNLAACELVESFSRALEKEEKRAAESN